MGTSRRPPKKPNPRAVAEGAGRAVRAAVGDPDEGTFTDGVVAHSEYIRRMGPESEGACDLGPYIEAARRDEDMAMHLDGAPARAIKFPGYYQRWFAAQTERSLAVLSRLVKWLSHRGEDDVEKRLIALDEVIDRHLARQALMKTWGKVWKLGLWLVPLTWSAVVYAGDKIGRVLEQLPVLRGVWKAIVGSV